MYIHPGKGSARGGTKRKMHKVAPHIRHVNGKRIKVKGHTRRAHGVKKRR